MTIANEIELPTIEHLVLEPDETVVGLAPLGEQAAGSPGLALGTRQGVVLRYAPRNGRCAQTSST